MERTTSFGYWVRRRRKALDLTQADLARQVGCAQVTIKKIERDERRPSRQMAERLAECLAIPAEEHHRFIQSALGERPVDQLPLFTEPPGPLGPEPGLPTFLTDSEAPTIGLHSGFVGRERELAQLEADLQRALDGHGGVLFVTGEAGQGKTALLTEFARRAHATHEQLIAAAGTCNAYTGVGDPYLPFRDVLRMLTGDVAPQVATGTTTREQARRLWQLMPHTVQALVEEGPALLDVFVSALALSRRVAAAVPGGTGWLARLKEIAAQERTGPGGLRQPQLFEQYARVLERLADHRPVLLLLDDLQWVDAASVNLLFHLGRRLTGSRILILGAYRLSDVAMERPWAGTGEEWLHPLRPVVNEFRRQFGEIQLHLGQMAPAEGRQFVDALLDREPNRLGEQFRSALSRQTQGHPLFTVELLQEMQERGELIRDEAGRWVEGADLDWTRLPARVEAVIEQRLERLPPDLREVLAAASVEGEVFTAEILAAVQGVTQRVILRSLSGDLRERHRLVREHGSTMVDGHQLTHYQFSHVLFQQYLYNRLATAERRLFHAEIARALEDAYRRHTDEVCLRLARHYAEAGEREKAVDYLLRAGDQARDRYAHQEAVQHYQQALAFLKEAGQYERAARALMKLGQTHHQSFDFQHARQAYEEGFTLWQQVGKSVSSVPRRSVGETLRIHWPNPRNLDPTRVSDSESEALIDQLFSGLLEQNADLDVVPGVARSWEVLAGGRSYLFHLRDDVRWSDGRPVTAGDFAHAWRRFLDPEKGSSLVSQLYSIKGARDFHEGRMTNWNQVGVHVIDETTLAVEMEEPTSYFPHLMALSYGYPVPRHVVEAHGEQWTEVEHIVTNGPFRLEQWRPDEFMLLSRSPTYYGPFSGNLEKVQVYFSPDGSSLPATMYANDELDVLTFFSHRKLPASEQDFLRLRFADDSITTPWLLTIYLGFVTTHPPFDDPRVRRALAMAANKEPYAHVIRSGSESPALGGFIPPGMPGHSRGIGLPYDPEAASRLLAAAGYRAGRDFPTVRAVTGPHRSDAASYLQAQWRANLGLDIAWEISDRRVSLAQINQGAADLFIVGWIADYPDPANYFTRNHHVIRQLRWHDPTFVALIDQAERTFEQNERIELYRQADKIVIDAAAMVPLVYGQNQTFIKKWVIHYPVSASKFWYWKDVVVGQRA